MAATGPTEGTDVIDIYAEEELNQVGTEEGEFVREADTNDLYDDVLTGTISNEWQRKEEEATALQKSAPSKPDTKPKVPYVSSGQGHKRLAVYIGNFSWWTTDLDLIKAAKNVGVRDILEVRIAENRANGQSKGYAEVVVASQNSLHRLMEVLPRHKVNGTKVEVRFATRQNIGAFENRAEKRMNQKSHSQESGVDFLGSPFPIASTETVASLPYPGTMTTVHPIFNHPPFVAEMACAIQPPVLPVAPPSRGFEAISNTPPVHLYPFVNPPPPISVPPSGSAPSTLNFNPALFPFPSSSLTSTTTDLYVRGSSINAFGHQSDPMTPLLSEAEFEEIMNRNQAISSTAISKALYDASTGEFREAAETLLTAIAVLRQSKVSCDVRCRVLITSLKDYLHSIESRLYGSRKHRRSQAKSYSNSLNGSRRHQERSHSDDHNEENYLGRSRDRARQRDQRDRDRQR